MAVRSGSASSRMGGALILLSDLEDLKSPEEDTFRILLLAPRLDEEVILMMEPKVEMVTLFSNGLELPSDRS